MPQRIVHFAALAALALDAASAWCQPTARWYRGNTHTHTLNSDGNATPDDVARWYRMKGYEFVVITDHEFLTDVVPLNGTIGAPGKFLVIRGQEVTQRLADPTVQPSGRRQAHINAIGINRVVMPVGSSDGATVARDATMADLYARNIAGIRAAGGIAQVNHPNWLWSVRLTDLLQLPDSVLMEIWNDQGGINNLGGTDDAGNVAPSTEAIWDTLLTRGKVVWGVADDDSHDFLGRSERNHAGPGKAWIFVRADTLTSEAIVAALSRGNFYSSNGITLSDIVVSDTGVALTIQRMGDARYVTRFIGKGGRTLAEVHGLTPRYRLRGDEGYVRAAIMDSNGLRAWTQPDAAVAAAWAGGK